MVDFLAQLGGIFALLTFIHFFVDWIFQRHDEAMRKHADAAVRAKHCAIYTIGFIPLLQFLHTPILPWLVIVSILFTSHFIEDTYYPVYLWAKYIRQVPEAQTEAGFSKWVQTPLGAILMIAIDQIIHIAFLLPVAFILTMRI